MVKWWRQKPTTDSDNDQRRDEHGCEHEKLERTTLMTTSQITLLKLIACSSYYYKLQ